MVYKRPICLTIAGFDPSGGAGILADCKTFEQHGVLGLSVLTANTFQTEDEFLDIQWISKETILRQLEMLTRRYKVRFFKIGLIENSETLLSILEFLQGLTYSSTVIWDPILKASSGGQWQNERFKKVGFNFSKLTFWCTPNLEEFQQLSLDLTNIKLLVKGGHSSDIGVDKLLIKSKEYRFLPKKVFSGTKHGTGCILSSAILANLALGRKDIASCLRAKRYLEKVMDSNQGLLGYHKN